MSTNSPVGVASALSAVAIVVSLCLLLVNCEQQDKKLGTSARSSGNRLVVISSVDDPSGDSFVRFNQSVGAYELKLELLRVTDAAGIVSYSNGLTTIGNLRARNKLRFDLLRAAVSSHRNERDSVLLLLDGASSIVNGDERAILSRFEEFHRTNGTQILFSADRNCWPDASLADKYPQLAPSGQADSTAIARDPQRFLSSRALIGFAPSLWELLAASEPLVDKSEYDLQLFATQVYLDAAVRERLKLELDHRSSLFANLDERERTDLDAAQPKQQAAWPAATLELEFVSEPNGAGERAGEATLKSSIHNSRPLVVHGAGSHAKIELNSLGNYLGRAWTLRDGCRLCNASMISLASIKNSDLPQVLIGVFIEEPTPFMESFFSALTQLNYPKERLHLFVHNAVEYHAAHVAAFLDAQGPQYASRRLIDSKSAWQLSEWEAREAGLRRCAELQCDHYLALDSVARLEWPESLRALIETNRTLVAPALSRPGKLWSNYWASMTRDGYYARSHDYVELVARERQGVWSVPLVMNAYLIEGKFLRRSLAVASEAASGANGATGANEPRASAAAANALAYRDEKFPTIKPALIFARNLRAANVLQFVNNMHDFGHLVDASNYNTSHPHPDLYELERNKPDWEREYLHENYTDLFDERDEDERHYPDRIRLQEPCQDVFWFPLVSEKFCDQLVDMMERFGQWSSGANSDPRIEGGYESVPTRDIHFKQVGLHGLWLTFLREFVMPIQLKEFIGYEHDPPRTDLAFVVRYHPAEQASLRPHHDSSTYTLNIALNEPGRDYEGGGCRFVRYNCSVTDSRKGWALIHPGRLTHYHEGLPVTRGTRYILVTFIDP